MEPRVMKVLVCGGRDFTDWGSVCITLYNICDEFKLWTEPDNYGNKLPEGITIISGAARGADSLAIDWAVVNWAPFKEYKADWTKHGRLAGPIRNQRMLDEEKPDLVIAFPGGYGTADMVTRAKAQGFQVREIPARKPDDQQAR